MGWRLSWQRICPQCGRPGFHPWAGKIPWRRERLPTPVFWPGKFHGLYSPWGHKEPDTTEQLSLFQVAQTIKNLPAMQETQFDPWVWKIPWRRSWQPTPAFVPGESPGERNLAGYSPWGCKKSDVTEQLTLSLLLHLAWKMKALSYYRANSWYEQHFQWAPCLLISDLTDNELRVRRGGELGAGEGSWALHLLRTPLASHPPSRQHHPGWKFAEL